MDGRLATPGPVRDYGFGDDPEAFYGDWRLYNDLIVVALGAMSPDELALRAVSDDPLSSTSWPIGRLPGTPREPGFTGCPTSLAFPVPRTPPSTA